MPAMKRFDHAELLFAEQSIQDTIYVMNQATAGIGQSPVLKFIPYKPQAKFSLPSANRFSPCMPV